MNELQGVVDYHPGDVTGTVAIEPKLDGWSGHACWVDGVPVLYTRNGMEIPLPHIQREVAMLMPQGFFFHGELTHHAGFEAIKSAIARQSEDIHFHIFDMVDEAFFEQGFDPTIYIQRRTQLERLMLARLAFWAPQNHVHLVCRECCNDIDDQHARHLELGYEGSVLKHLDSPYRSGPTGDWMRIKPVSTTDCTIIGVEQSKTDPSRASSFVVCEPSGVTSKVHAGLTEDILREALEHPARFVDQVMETNHRGRYDSGKMRHASFVRMRPDKSATPAAQGVLV